MRPATPVAPFRRFVNWTLLIPLGVSSVLFLYGSASRLTVRYGLEYGEGIVLWQAAHIGTPTEAYHPITEYPYVVFHYPPLFHSMSRLAGDLVGDLLIGGRLVSLLSTVAIMVALALLVLRWRGPVVDRAALWTGALAAAGLATTLGNLREWVPAMRVDMLGLMFSLVGTGLFIEGSRRPVLRYVAVVCLVAGVFTKHTFLAAPLACLIVSAVEDRRQTTRLAAFATALGLGAFLLLQSLTNGQFFVHLFVHNQNAYSLSHGIEMQVANATSAWPVLVLALIALAWLAADQSTRAARGSRDATVRCLSLYLAFAFLVSWTSGKFGSASNYFLELDLLCCAFAGLLAALAFDPPRRRQVLTAATVSIFILVTSAFGLPNFADTVMRLSQGARALEASRVEDGRKVLQLVQSVPGPVFSWDLMVLMLAHKDIPLEPAIMFDLAKSGKWNMTPFLAQIHDGRYDLIVTNSYTEWLPSDAVTDAMAGTYAPAERFGTYQVYRPVHR